MAGYKTGYAVIGALLALGAAAWWWQQQATALLLVEAEAARAEVRDLERVRAEHRRLAATQVPAQELENLRADHAALARMRGEVDALKQGIEKDARTPVSLASLAPPVEHRKLSASEWKNAGRATPAAAVETVLWAAAGGDVDALAAAITFDAKARPSIDAFFAAIPAEMRQQYGTPERLAAFFTAKDIPLGSATFTAQKETGPDEMMVAVILQGPTGDGRGAKLNVRRGDDGWRLVVPTAAIQNYANIIGGALSSGK